MAGSHFTNATWSGLAAGIRALTGLISALLAIRLLGVGDYGHVATWLSLFVLYLSLNSSAFTMLVVKLVAAGSDGQPFDPNTATAVAMRFCLWSLALLVLMTIFLTVYAGRLPLLGVMFSEKFSDVIMLGGLLTATQIFVALQAAVIEGAGRLDLATKWQLAGPLVVVAGLSYAFAVGRDLSAEAYLAVLCCGSFVDLALLWNIRYLLGLRLSISTPVAENSIGVLSMLRSGGLLQATTLLNLFLEPANKFLLNHLAGSSAVAIYDLAMKIVWGIQHLVGAAMRVFLHIGSQDPMAVSKTFAKAISALGVPVVTMHAAGALFLFWVGKYWMLIDTTELIIFFGIATISNFGMIFVTPLYLSLIGRNELFFIFRTQALLASVNLLVSSAAIPLVGLIGAAFGLLLATVLNTVTIYVRCQLDAKVLSDSAVPISRAKRRLAIAIALLVATIFWATVGGDHPLILLVIIVGFCVMMASEPLVGRVINQLFPGVPNEKNGDSSVKSKIDEFRD